MTTTGEDDARYWEARALSAEDDLTALRKDFRDYAEHMSRRELHGPVVFCEDVTAEVLKRLDT